MAIRIILLVMAALGVYPETSLRRSRFDPSIRCLAVITPETAIVVDLEDGRRISANVVSLAGDRLELRRRRWNFRSEHLVFSAPLVRRIEERDSTINGTMIGFGAGALAAWVKCKTSGPGYGVDLGCVWWSFSQLRCSGSRRSRHRLESPAGSYIAPGSRIQPAPARGVGIGIATTIGLDRRQLSLTACTTVIPHRDICAQLQIRAPQPLAPFLPEGHAYPLENDDGWAMVYCPLEPRFWRPPAAASASTAISSATGSARGVTSRRQQH